MCRTWKSLNLKCIKPKRHPAFFLLPCGAAGHTSVQGGEIFTSSVFLEVGVDRASIPHYISNFVISTKCANNNMFMFDFVT